MTAADAFEAVESQRRQARPKTCRLRCVTIVAVTVAQCSSTITLLDGQLIAVVFVVRMVS